MKLIKRNFWILKEHNNFSDLWKFEPDIPNTLGEILFENLQRMWELINVLPPSNFAVFDCCYFLCYWLRGTETCTNCKNYPALLIFEPNWYIRLNLLTRMLMSKNWNKNVTMNPPISSVVSLNVKLFADDSVSEQWAAMWQMNVAPSKCYTMLITLKQQPPSFLSILCNTPWKGVTSGRGVGGRGSSTNFHTRRLRPEVQPLTLLCTIFHEKGTPFVFFLLTNGTAITYLV